MFETATAAYRRRDISDRARETIAPHLSSAPGKVGSPTQDNRRFRNAAFQILRAGAPRRHLLPTTDTGTPPRAASDAGRKTAGEREPNRWLPCPMTPILSG